MRNWKEDKRGLNTSEIIPKSRGKEKNGGNTKTNRLQGTLFFLQKYFSTSWKILSFL